MKEFRKKDLLQLRGYKLEEMSTSGAINTIKTKLNVDNKIAIPLYKAWRKFYMNPGYHKEQKTLEEWINKKGEKSKKLTEEKIYAIIELYNKGYSEVVIKEVLELNISLVNLNTLIHEASRYGFVKIKSDKRGRAKCKK